MMQRPVVFGGDSNNSSFESLYHRGGPEEVNSHSRASGSIHHHRRRRDLAWGVRLIQALSDWWFPNLVINRDLWYRVSVLVITYVCYTSYHLSRKPISIVKNVLSRNCTDGEVPSAPGHSCGWAPFDREDADVLLGTLDSAFLCAYAAGMFVSGFVAERVNLRYFLSLGMLLSGFFTYLFGMAYSRNIHNLSYFILVQALAGVLQTTGWPGVVTVVGNWFGKGKRGLIFGLWNSHTFLGNILGSLIAGSFLANWGLSFIVPAAIIGACGFLVFLFLVPKPQHVHCSLPEHNEEELYVENSNEESPSTSIQSRNGNNGRYRYSRDCEEMNDTCAEDTPMLPSYDPDAKIKAVGFTEALKIPGVIEFSMCLFFAKLVSYTFLYWLPRYIHSSTNLGPKDSGDLSTLFDVGSIIGGIIAGVISDYTSMSATTCAGMLTAAIPMMLVYETYGAESVLINSMLLIPVGILVNGPNCLIATAVAAELGTHPVLMGNARALATVTAIIDGTGSIGAAIGPLLVGAMSTIDPKSGWTYVFLMLMMAEVLALLTLVRQVSHDFKRFFEKQHAKRIRVTIHPIPGVDDQVP